MHRGQAKLYTMGVCTMVRVVIAALCALVMCPQPGLAALGLAAPGLSAERVPQRPTLLIKDALQPSLAIPVFPETFCLRDAEFDGAE